MAAKGGFHLPGPWSLTATASLAEQLSYATIAGTESQLSY
jgi:hypothetical protein